MRLGAARVVLGFRVGVRGWIGVVRVSDAFVPFAIYPPSGYAETIFRVGAGWLARMVWMWRAARVLRLAGVARVRLSWIVGSRAR